MMRYSENELNRFFSELPIFMKERDYKLKKYESEIAERRMVILWGAGFDGILMADMLWDVLKGRHVCFIDQDERLHGRTICHGIICYGKERLDEAIREYGMDAILVIICSYRSMNEIYDNIFSTGGGT